MNGGTIYIHVETGDINWDIFSSYKKSNYVIDWIANFSKVSFRVIQIRIVTTNRNKEFMAQGESISADSGVWGDFEAYGPKDRSGEQNNTMQVFPLSSSKTRFLSVYTQHGSKPLGMGSGLKKRLLSSLPHQTCLGPAAPSCCIRAHHLNGAWPWGTEERSKCCLILQVVMTSLLFHISSFYVYICPYAHFCKRCWYRCRYRYTYRDR